MPDSTRQLEPDDLDRCIERARAGDVEARELLYRRFREPLLARIRLMMGEGARRLAESSDFLQSTFTAALPGLEDFEHGGGDTFLRWLTAIARNKIRGDLRKRREQALSMLSSAIHDAPPPAQDASGALSLDSALALLEALEELSEEERELVELHDLEGLSFVEIGRKLGCSDRHAHRRHGRALLRLSRLLGA